MMLASQDKQAKHGTLCGLPVARTGSIKGESSQATISSLAFDSICVTEVSSGRAVTSQRLTVVDSQVRSRGDQARMQEQRRSKGYICAMVYMRHGIYAPWYRSKATFATGSRSNVHMAPFAMHRQTFIYLAVGKAKVPEPIQRGLSGNSSEIWVDNGISFYLLAFPHKPWRASRLTEWERKVAFQTRLNSLAYGHKSHRSLWNLTLALFRSGTDSSLAWCMNRPGTIEGCKPSLKLTRSRFMLDSAVDRAKKGGI